MYAWIITKDHLASAMGKNEAGTMGPRGVAQTAEQIKAKGKRFQMFDDDDALYYTGYLIETDDTDGFEPLDDFGMPNAGCTGIKYDGEYL